MCNCVILNPTHGLMVTEIRALTISWLISESSTMKLLKESDEDWKIR